MLYNQKDEKNNYWKGDRAGNRAIHVWVKKRFEHIINCQNCGKSGRLDLSNKTGIYNRELKNWQKLCRSCHLKFDKHKNGMTGKKHKLLSRKKISNSIKLWWEKRKIKYLEKYL